MGQLKGVYKKIKKRRLYRGQPPYLEDFNEKVTTHVSMGALTCMSNSSSYILKLDAA